jgi:hypothetical protein
MTRILSLIVSFSLLYAFSAKSQWLPDQNTDIFDLHLLEIPLVHHVENDQHIATLYEDNRMIIQKLDSMLGLIYDTGTNAYSLGTKAEYDYNAYGSVSEYALHYVNSQGVLTPFLKNTYTYGADQLNIGQTLMFWEGSEGWVNNTLLQIVYNANNLPSERTLQSWNTSTQSWVNDEWDLVEYNNDNLVTQRTISLWLQGQWQFFNLLEYEYDNQNRITQYSESVWDTNTMDWRLNEQKLFEYDDNANIITETNYEYDYPSDGMLPYNRFIMFYNSEDNMITRFEEMYFTNWFSVSQENYTYDGQANLIEGIVSLPIMGSDAYEPSEKYTRTYDLAFGPDQLVVPVEEMFSGNKLIDETKEVFNTSSGEWDPSYHAIFYYSEATGLNTGDINGVHVAVYPNPASQILNVILEADFPVWMNLYAADGRLVLQQQLLQETSAIDISKIASGKYTYSIDADDSHVTGQLLIAE